MAAMDQQAVLRRLREEEERVAVSLVGASGQTDPGGAIREVLLRRRREGDVDIRVKVTVPDGLMRGLFMTLCARYGVQPYRRPRQRESTLMVEAPERFLEDVLLPLFRACGDIVQNEIYAWLNELLHHFRATDSREQEK
jgi:hypothetical protein